jgi:hypothetical protein
MYYQLSKSQKKIARIVMDKGLDKHYLNALNETQSVLLKWKNDDFSNNREAYMVLFNCVERNNKNIADVYNDKGGSRWVEIMALQLSDGVISIDDLKAFDKEVADVIIFMSRI